MASSDRNSQPVVVYTEDNFPVTNFGETDANTRQFKPFIQRLGGNLATDTIAAGQGSYAAVPVDDIYLESIRFSFVFSGLSGDLDFEGWGEAAALAVPIQLDIQPYSTWDTETVPTDPYYFEFSTLAELMSFGDTNIFRDGNSVYISVEKRYENMIYLSQAATQDDSPIIWLGIKDTISPPANGINTGGCSWGGCFIKFRSSIRTDLEETAFPS